MFVFSPEFNNQPNQQKIIFDQIEKKISANINHHLFGIQGTCHAQNPQFLHEACDEYISLYSDNTKSHEIGQKTVDLIISVINSLPEFYAFQTPSNSYADVVLKWDLIISYQEYYYPVQIKSGLSKMEEALELNLDNITQNLSKIEDKIYSIEEKINESNVLEEESDFKSYSRKEHIGKLKLNSDILKVKYQFLSNSIPLYIWADSSDTLTIESILQEFTNSLGLQKSYPLFIKIAHNIFKQKRRKKEENDPRFTLMQQRQEKIKLAQRLKKERRGRLTSFLRHTNSLVENSLESEQHIQNHSITRETIEKLITLFEYQVLRKRKRIRNRKNRNVLVRPELTESLNIAEKVLGYLKQEIMPFFGSDLGEKESLVISQHENLSRIEELLLSCTEKLYDLDQRTDSPIVIETQGLHKLVKSLFIHID